MTPMEDVHDASKGNEWQGIVCVKKSMSARFSVDALCPEHLTKVRDFHYIINMSQVVH